MIANRFCLRCQKMVPERGLHQCVKAKAPPSPTASPTIAASHNTAPEASPTIKRGGYARNARWRDENRERYNSYMAAYRRERRHGQRDAKMELPTFAAVEKDETLSISGRTS